MNERPMDRAKELSDYAEVFQALQTGTYRKGGDLIDWTLWDRLTLANATLRHTLFQNGIGTVVAGAARNLADTNVEGSQGIPAGSKLYVRALVLIYQSKAIKTSATMQDVHEMLQETSFNIHVRGKDSQGQWIGDELMGVPVSGVVFETTEVITHPSIGTFAGVKLLNLPIVLAAQTYFDVQVEHHVAPSADIDDDKVKFGLAGILERLS